MRYSIILAFSIFILFPALAFSVTIHIPADYPTIQQGIDAAVNGDIVLVAPGTYVENIDFKGKAITVTSEQRVDVTVIDGNGNGYPGVTCFSGEGPDSVLNGFTITNCVFPGMWDWGGGMTNLGSSPTVINCTFTGNSAFLEGGGMYNSGSNPTVINCTFSDNWADTGGGMNNWNNCSPTVTNCIFWNDIIRNYNTTPTITYCCIQGGYIGTGNIDSDPLFLDPANADFHLTFNSPCRGSGDNNAITELTDFEGDPRIAYGTVDMGADEFYTHLYWTGDATPGGNVEIKFVGLPGTSPVGLCIGTGVLDPPLKSMWGDWYLLFPIIGPVSLGPITSPEGVLIIPGTIPASPPAPYSLPMQVLIGTELTSLSVLEIK